jgi:hypothetical protein
MENLVTSYHMTRIQAVCHLFVASIFALVVLLVALRTRGILVALEKLCDKGIAQTIPAAQLATQLHPQLCSCDSPTCVLSGEIDLTAKGIGDYKTRKTKRTLADP